MARKPRASKKAQDAAGAVARSNGISGEVVKSYIERWDALDQELSSEKGSFMKKAKTIAEGKKELLSEAKTRGINPKALRSEIKCRNLGNKIHAERASLEAEDAEQAELIREAINSLNTPVTQSSAADKREADSGLSDSLTGDDDEDD